MSTPTPTTPTTPALDWNKAKAHLEDVTKTVLEYAGRPGYNPHFYLAEKVRPLEQLMATDTGRTQDTYDKILALSKSKTLITIDSKVAAHTDIRLAAQELEAARVTAALVKGA